MIDYRHEFTLDLPELEKLAGNEHRNLCARLERAPDGTHRAVLVDFEEFRGHGSTQQLALEDLIDDLERVADEIRRVSGFGFPKQWRGGR